MTSIPTRERPAGRGSLGDPASAVLTRPGSTKVSSLLMQDTVSAMAASVAHGPSAGTLTGKVALFANPFLDSKEEALVVNEVGELTYLRRAATGTGWLQQPVAQDGKEIKAAEVVIVVHPRDLAVFAIYTPGATGAPAVLELVATVTGDVTTCTWETRPRALQINPGTSVGGLTRLSVFYDGRTPGVTGVDPTTGRIVGITAETAEVAHFIVAVFPTSFTAEGPVDELAAGQLAGRANVLGAEFLPVCYLRFGARLIRYDTIKNTIERVANNVSRVVGVYRAWGRPDVGCVYLDTEGNLVTWNLTAPLGPVPSVVKTPGLGLVTGRLWNDVNNMAHVYGVDGTNTLKVLHQVSWDINGAPIWSTALAKPPKRHRAEVRTPTCVGLVPDVVAFAIDPFPDYQPNEFVKFQGTATPDEQFSFFTQDITSARWSRDKVRLVPSSDDPLSQKPHIVTNYVTCVTVLDQRGGLMPGLTVKISAESLVEIQVDGASYLVGPGHSVQLPTNMLGKIVISVPADSLIPATLHVDAVGLANGAVIQPAASVHDYLAGNGTLSSQKGVFDTEALTKANIVGEGHKSSIADTVDTTKQVFKAASGAPLTSRLLRGDGTVQSIHGFSFGRAPAGHADGPSRSVYREFDTPEQLQSYLDTIRSQPNYGGKWEDFANWAGDVWEGIKNGVIEVVDVVVGAVATVLIKIGEMTIELIGFILDTVESAVRAVEAVFAKIAVAASKVVDWLKALFAFRDIWDTKVALQSYLGTVLSYGSGAADHFNDVTKKWFEDQEANVKTYFERLKKEYTGRPLGDSTNQVPMMTDASGHGTTPQKILDDPQAGWLLNQSVNGPALAAFRAAEGRPTDPAHPSTVAGLALADAFAEVMRTFDGSGIQSAVSTQMGDFDTAVASVADPRDPDAGSKASMVALISLVEDLIQNFLHAIGSVVAQVLAMVKVLAENLLVAMSEPLTDGPLKTLYLWIQEQASVEEPEEATIGGLIILMVAFLGTVVYKLVHGVDQAPFPRQAVPAFGAPPWHVDYDPSLRGELDREGNRGLKILQFFLGIAGVTGGFFDTVSDVIPVTMGSGDKGWSAGAQEFFAWGSLICSAGLYGVGTSFPLLTGTQFDDQDWLWTGAFVVSLANLGLSGGAIWWNKKKGGDSPILRNAYDVWLGPLAVSVVSWCYLGTAGAAINRAGTNSYTAASTLLSAVPGGIQFLRCGIAKGSPLPYKVERAGFVAVVDEAASLSSSVMLMAASFATGAPVIRQTPLRDGVAGQPYTAQLSTVSGGTWVFNQPIKNWKVSEGKLPAGLILDPVNGMISGTPTVGGVTSAFSVTCTDSYGPPQVSSPQPMTITIG